MRTGALRLIWSNPRQYVCVLFLLVCAWTLGVRLVLQAPQLHSRTQDALAAVHPAAQMGGLIHNKRTPNASWYANGGLGTFEGTPRAYQGHTKGTPRASCYAHGGLVYSKRTPSESCYANGGLDTQLNAHPVRTECTLSASCYANGGAGT
jgi:hypothetical protein